MVSNISNDSNENKSGCGKSIFRLQLKRKHRLLVLQSIRLGSITEMLTQFAKYHLHQGMRTHQFAHPQQTTRFCPQFVMHFLRSIARWGLALFFPLLSFVDSVSSL